MYSRSISGIKFKRTRSNSQTKKRKGRKKKRAATDKVVEDTKQLLKTDPSDQEDFSEPPNKKCHIDTKESITTSLVNKLHSELCLPDSSVTSPLLSAETESSMESEVAGGGGGEGEGEGGGGEGEEGGGGGEGRGGGGGGEVKGERGEELRIANENVFVNRRSQLVLGVNCVTRLLEQGRLEAGLVCSSGPALLLQHLLPLAALRVVPFASLPNMSKTISRCLGIKKAMCIGIKVLL